MPKRQVSYNQEAVLCPVCTKRMRLNNDGRVRVHVSGKAGSEQCSGSYAEVTKTGKVLTSKVIEELAATAEVGYDLDTIMPLFSDAE